LIAEQQSKVKISLKKLFIQNPNHKAKMQSVFKSPLQPSAVKREVANAKTAIAWTQTNLALELQNARFQVELVIM
jgi:hypothetical protein